MGDLNDTNNTQGTDVNNSQQSVTNNITEFSQAKSVMNKDSMGTQNMYNTDMDSFDSNPKKKKSKGKFVILFLVIVLVLSGSIVAYANRGKIANTVAVMTKNPEDYYSYIEKKAFDDAIDSLTNQYKKYSDQLLKADSAGVAQDTNLKVSVNPSFSSIFGFGDIKSAELNISASSKDGKGQSTIKASYDNKLLATLEALMNSDSNELFLRVPELSSAYLMLSLDELLETTDMTGDLNVEDYFKDIEDLLDEDAIAPEVINSILKKYTAIIVDNITDVSMDKNEKVEASDITSKYNMLTVELDGSDAYDIAMEILKAARKDDEIIDILTTFDICKEKEYTTLIDELIDSLKGEKDVLKDSGDTIVMDVYVDNAGKVKGREFRIEGEDEISLGYYLTQDGSKLGLSGWLTAEDQDIASINANATYKNGGLTGEAVIEYSEYSYAYDDFTTYSVDIDFENAKIIKNKGYINGKFTISSDLLMGMEIVFDCKATSKKQDVIFDLIYNGMKTVTLEVSSTEGANKKVKFPDEDKEEVYDAMDDIDSYFSTMDMEGFISNLEDVLQIEDLEYYIEDLLYYLY